MHRKMIHMERDLRRYNGFYKTKQKGAQPRLLGTAAQRDCLAAPQRGCSAVPHDCSAQLLSTALAWLGMHSCTAARRGWRQSAGNTWLGSLGSIRSAQFALLRSFGLPKECSVHAIEARHLPAKEHRILLSSHSYSSVSRASFLSAPALYFHKPTLSTVHTSSLAQQLRLAPACKRETASRLC